MQSGGRNYNHHFTILIRLDLHWRLLGTSNWVLFCLFHAFIIFWSFSRRLLFSNWYLFATGRQQMFTGYEQKIYKNFSLMTTAVKHGMLWRVATSAVLFVKRHLEQTMRYIWMWRNSSWYVAKNSLSVALIFLALQGCFWSGLICILHLSKQLNKDDLRGGNRLCSFADHE